MRKKLLIITSSGGGGLIQAANAKEQAALAKDPTLVIIRRDVLKDWVWAPIGHFFINFWNGAQSRGNVFAQTFCGAGQFLVDIFIHPMVFFHAVYTFIKEDIDHIIDTQNMATSAIMKALRVFNRRTGKNIRLEKVIVDLPTKGATHFFRPIKKLSKANRAALQVRSIQPLLEPGESADQFWQATCGLCERDIHYEDVNVRRAFSQYRGKKRPTDAIQIPIHCKSQEEVDLSVKSFERGTIEAHVDGHTVTFTIPATCWMITTLLGSQPAGSSMLSYVSQWIHVAKKRPNTSYNLFVFCADHKKGREDLFYKMVQLVSETKDYPKNLSVIPFSFQKEEVIAPMFHRSDITCTRSGGGTAMELICVATGQIWIHSEARGNQDLLDGIPAWESASAVYLQKLHGAKIVTPHTFASIIIPGEIQKSGAVKETP